MVWFPCGLATTTAFCCCVAIGCWDGSDCTTLPWDDADGAFCITLFTVPVRTFPAFPKKKQNINTILSKWHEEGRCPDATPVGQQEDPH